MRRTEVAVTTGVRFYGENPFIETKARVIHSADSSLPEGRVFIFKTPILPPGATEAEIRASTKMQVFDRPPAYS